MCSVYRACLFLYGNVFFGIKITSRYLPNATSYGTGVVYSNKLIGCSGNVEVRLFFVNKKRIGYPDVFDELRSDGERFHTWSLSEGQPWICPELSKVEIQRKILTK